MVHDLLHIIESEAAEDGKTTPKPKVLGESESTDGSGGENEGSKARDSHDGSASEERTTDVEILVLLSGRTDKGDGAHHGESVETGAGEESRGSDCHEWGNKGGLGGVEAGPQSVFGDIAVNSVLA